MKQHLFSATACNLDAHILQATLPLFAAERVEAIEWSFDTLTKVRTIPEWFTELLHTYGSAGRLVGHGVFFSLFSGKWLPEQQQWLDHLKKVSAQFTFDHITEHFGFMTGEDFHKGAPISVPYTASTLAIGIDRLQRMQDVCRCPVGLENLAFSYSPDEVRRHGEFLERLIAPVNGFIILDLHNLYCQLHNFDLAFEELIAAYPLDRVREVHISGGSWEDSEARPERIVRRDTHDDAVPAEVFALLQKALPLCPNLKFVVLEQMGAALITAESQARYRRDFEQMRTIVDTCNAQRSAGANAFLPETFAIPGAPVEDDALYSQQLALSEILESAAGYADARERLLASPLAGSAWKAEEWSDYMVETAVRIAGKWREGWK